MTKLNIILSSGTVFKNSEELHQGIADFLRDCIDSDYKIIIITHKKEKISKYNSVVEEIIGKGPYVYSRELIKNQLTTLKKSKNEALHKCVLVGGCKPDLYLATNNNILFLYSEWYLDSEDDAKKYGFNIKTTHQLIKLLNILTNQTKFYYELDIDEKTKLYALTSANNNKATENESEMITNFRNVLKLGKRNFFAPLFFHLISSVMKSKELREIDIWANVPSSSTKENEDMVEIKDRCRYLTNKKRKYPLFIRHTKVEKSHHTPYEQRIKIGAQKHFESIMINPKYKNKLKGKTICVIDDYVTNGCTFEAIRNLLIHAGVKKIYFFAFGRFVRGNNGVYQREIYELKGDIYSKKYSFNLNEREDISRNGIFHEEAKIEVEQIRDILYKK